MAEFGGSRFGDVNIQMMRVARAYRTAAAAQLSRLGLYPGQEALLIELWRDEGRSQVSLAEALRVEPPTVTKMVQRMEASGLVTRTVDPADRRAVRVSLTPEGRKLKSQVLAITAELKARTLAGLSDRQQADLRGLLATLEVNLAS